jgi:hypothetical protein
MFTIRWTRGLLLVEIWRTERTTGRLRYDSRQRRKDFSSILCVQTGSVAHPASCTMGTGGSLSEGKARPGRGADHSPHLVPRSMSRSYTSSPLRAFEACSGTALALRRTESHTDWKHHAVKRTYRGFVCTVFWGCCDDILDWITGDLKLLRVRKCMQAWCLLFVQWL